MNALLHVARYHLVKLDSLVFIPWVMLLFVFGVNALILALTPVGHGVYRPVGGLAAFFIMFLVCGVTSVARYLPFGLSLGISRRTYYLGTTGLALALAAVYGLAIVLLQLVEKATSGWDMGMGFFRIPYILDGPWYLTWVTSFVVLALMFLWGMWLGLVYRRWNFIGLWGFIAAQISVVVGLALVITWADGWSSVARFFSTLSGAGLTGLLAALAVMLMAGGYATMRRVTV